MHSEVSDSANSKSKDTKFIDFYIVYMKINSSPFHKGYRNTSIILMMTCV
jgi:hypothetical protein